MSELTDKIRAVVARDDGNVIFTLREPTKQELNEFLGKRYEVGKRNRMQDKSLPARIDFFDLLVIDVENLTRGGNPVTVEDKDIIPATWKNDVIFKCFEDNDVEIKN